MDWQEKLAEWFRDFQDSFYQSFIKDDRYLYLVKGLGITISVAILALMIGIVLGTIVAVIRTSHDQDRRKKVTAGGIVLQVLNGICKVYLTVIRGTPMMVQLLIMYFVILKSSSEMLVAVLAFGINSGAYVAEIVRSGLMSVDAGQMEAGRSLGMNYVKAMWYIVIPQAVKNILPALGNEMITLLKDTSLVTVIGLKDLTKGAMIIQGRTYAAFMPLIAIAVIYLAVVMLLGKLLSVFERRLRASDKR